jgi:hypothetical protein
LRLLKLFLLTCIFSTNLCAYDPNAWVQLNSLYVAKESPSQLNVIAINSYLSDLQPAYQWNVVDLSNYLPEGAKAVNLSGLLIITHGTSIETADMHLYFRRYGSTDTSIYIGQVIEASTLNGQRCTASYWVPLSEDLKFEFYWTRTNLGQYPDYSAYGMKFYINAWAN